MKIIMKDTALAGKEFDSLWDLLESQEKLRKSCKHAIKNREVESGVCGMHNRRRAWVRVRCSYCSEVLESHETPLLQTKLPKQKG